MNNDLLIYLSEYKTKGNELIFRHCPFCEGTTKDKYKFFVNLSKETYICFRGKCGSKGHISELYKHFGVEYKRDGVTVNKYNDTVKKEILQEAKNFDNMKFEPLKEIDQGYKYLELRGIKEETIKHFKVSKDKKNNIVFPFYKNNKLECIKYRIPKKAEKGKLKTWQEAGGKPVLFNCDNINWTKPVVITEGEIDGMSVWQSGYKNVVSVPFGVANWEWINNHWDNLKVAETLIICGDNDEAGEKFNNECVKKFGINKVMFINNKYNDLNLLLYKEGPEVVNSIICAAKYKKIDGLIKGEDIEKYKIDTNNRIDTGFQKLNTILGGFLPGTLTILSGKRGNGKSTLASQFIIEAINNNKSCCVYSGELSKELFKHWLFLQIAGIHVKKEYDDFRKKEVEIITDQQFEILNNWISNKLYVYDNTVLERKDLKEASILEIFKYAANRHNCKLFLVDNLMTARNQYDSEGFDFYKKQGEFIGSFKTFANDFGVSVIFVAHPKKNDNNSNFKNDDVAGSSENTDRADNIIVAQKLEDEEIEEFGCCSLLHINKNRLYGETATIRFDFNQDCKRFIEVNGVLKDYVNLNEYTVKKEENNFEECPF